MRTGSEGIRAARATRCVHRFTQKESNSPSSIMRPVLPSRSSADWNVRCTFRQYSSGARRVESDLIWREPRREIGTLHSLLALVL
jgi:hypothetical protein